MSNPKLLNEEQLNYLKEIVESRTCKEIATLMNEKFNKNYTDKQIKYQKRVYHLKSGIDAKFQKNQKAHNHKKIGDEFISKNGYTYIKIAEPNTWIQKQRYVYEKYCGKIPKGYSVIFLNQDKQDFAIDNLMLVRSKDKLTCKNANLFSHIKEITRTGIMTAQLINKTYEIENK